MTTELTIFVFLFLMLGAICLVLAAKVDRMRNENGELQELIFRQEGCISNQEMRIEELEMKLAKKDAIICILRNEINKKENAK